MISLTENRSKVLNFLIRNFSKKNSIRMVAKEVGLSPMGTQKILKEFEVEGMVEKEKIGTGIFYSVNLNNEVGFKLAELILLQNKLNSYAKIYAKDLEQLKKYISACVLFGSVLIKGEKAKDIDVLVIIDKKNFERVEEEKRRLEKISVKPIHFIYQTQKDFNGNVKKRDEPILDMIKKGAVLWGQDFILKGIKNGI